MFKNLTDAYNAINQSMFKSTRRLSSFIFKISDAYSNFCDVEIGKSDVFIHPDDPNAIYFKTYILLKGIDVKEFMDNEELTGLEIEMLNKDGDKIMTEEDPKHSSKGVILSYQTEAFRIN